MNLSEKIAVMFQSIGEPITVSIEGVSHQVYAIIQPMRYKNKLYLEQERNELGFKDSECFLYLGPAEADFAGVERYTWIKTEDRSYNVSRADRIAIGGKTQYIWAVLTLRLKDGEYDEF
ncbi:MAG: hypothetical protein IIX60_02570 [Clostridia bacterium]|nr:hypothetical protein [Clostridia bacterium]